MIVKKADGIGTYSFPPEIKTRPLPLSVIAMALMAAGVWLIRHWCAIR